MKTETNICPNCEAEVPAKLIERIEIEDVITEDWDCLVCHREWIDIRREPKPKANSQYTDANLGMLYTVLYRYDKVTFDDLYTAHKAQMERWCEESIRFRFWYRWFMFWDWTVTNWLITIGWYRLLNKVGWYKLTDWLSERMER